MWPTRIAADDLTCCSSATNSTRTGNGPAALQLFGYVSLFRAVTLIPRVVAAVLGP